MRPSIAGMFDSKIRIWRPAEGKDDLGVEERDYAPVAVVDCFVNRPRQPEADIGAGLAPVGSTRWYGLPSIDVRPRDVCEVVEGPEAGKRFEVNEPPVRPKNHHTQVDCIEFNGTLPQPQS
jgi:hypothetical protein